MPPETLWMPGSTSTDNSRVQNLLCEVDAGLRRRGNKGSISVKLRRVNAMLSMVEIHGFNTKYILHLVAGKYLHIGDLTRSPVSTKWVAKKIDKISISALDISDAEDYEEALYILTSIDVS